MTLNGYWTFPPHIAREEIQAFGKALEKWPGDKPLLVSKGIEFHPFEQPRPQMVGYLYPDALCRYCWSPNLNTSTHCQKCGAPLVH